MQKTVIALLYLALLLSANAKDILVNSWSTKDRSVDIEFYSYESGGSGYYKVINNTTNGLRVTFSYTTNKGIISKQTTPVDAGRFSTGSCASAGKKNAGIKSVAILEIASEKAVNEDGIPANTLVEDPRTPNARLRVPQSTSSGQKTASTKSSGSGITGTWSNSKLTWKFGADGKATLTVPSLKGNGVASTYMTYQANPNTGVFAYTITRATLTGSLNSNGRSDYDMPVNKSYTEKYMLSGGTLTIGTEVMSRN